jgi:hypothetical protein
MTFRRSLAPRRILQALVCSAALPCALRAQAPVEIRPLDGLASPARWDPAECALAVSAHAPSGRPALRVHMPVDYHAGEKSYPIGWPRLYLNLKPDEQGWGAYDRFEFEIFAESSRAGLPKRPLAFHLYDAQGQKKLIGLDTLALGAWRTIALSLSDLGFTGDVARLGFNINESDYADGDAVDFHIGAFRLARATAASLTELRLAAPALFCDSRVLPVEIVAEGPPQKLAEGVPFRLSGAGRVALALTLPVARGRQTLYLPLAGAALTPGDYVLSACPDDPSRKREALLAVTSSPWR